MEKRHFNCGTNKVLLKIDCRVISTPCDLKSCGRSCYLIKAFTFYFLQIYYFHLQLKGQEMPVIILSTTRSTSSTTTSASGLPLHSDVKQGLGFIASPKRMNVAVTRNYY